MTEKFKTCDCGTRFEMPDLPEAESEIGKVFKRMAAKAVCDDCERARWFAPKPEPQNWNLICPPLYRQTDPARIKDQAMLAKVMAWDYGPKGLGLLGPSDQCKTRMIFLLLNRQHSLGRSVAQCTGTEFALKMANLERRTQFLEECIAADILYLDDIDKAKFTERVEADLMHVIEGRTSRLKPILFAVNASGSDLEAMLSENRGEPIVRRLREFCGILIVGRSHVAEPVSATTTTH